MTNNLVKYLSGGDLRSIADVDKVVSLIKTQTDFEQLFQYLLTDDRLIVMRAADAVEKVTLHNPEYLTGHSQDVINLLNVAVDKELKWHLALIASRLDFSATELGMVWNKLKQWVKDKNESKIVRVNSVQALFELANKNEGFKREFEIIVQEIKAANIPSINARLRKLGIK
ncbi:hypothetical protein CSA80_02870 [Candidatus Saccharibacteria bacterium]|nr:MAG: hypothetical protein CR973_02990 [Candidatus Saccharibacteria bacterium]PID99034.1 MAG: hypothetical protein CSA80_02870 [Candidatus Saccharibacteria bacterium]